MSRLTDAQTIEQLRARVRELHEQVSQLQRDRDQLWEILYVKGLLSNSSVIPRLPRLPVPGRLTPEEFHRMPPESQWLSYATSNPTLTSRFRF